MFLPFRRYLHGGQEDVCCGRQGFDKNQTPQSVWAFRASRQFLYGIYGLMRTSSHAHICHKGMRGWRLSRKAQAEKTKKNTNCNPVIKRANCRSRGHSSLRHCSLRHCSKILSGSRLLAVLRAGMPAAPTICLFPYFISFETSFTV